MKRRIITAIAAWGLAAGVVFLSSCGGEEQKAAAPVDPAARKAAIEKLEARGIAFNPRSFSAQLSGNCKAEVLGLFLEAGMPLNGATGSGANALMVVILNNTDKEEVVKCAELLLKRGINVRATDRSGQTALHYAVGRNNPALVRLLIEAGADVNAVDRSGLSVLQRTFSSEIIEILKAAGAKEHSKYELGNF